MGASKTDHYTINELKEALVGRALAHPARIKIIHLLNKNEVVYPTELTNLLHLTKSSVHDHLNKLISADIVSVKFKNNGYQLILNRTILREYISTLSIYS